MNIDLFICLNLFRHSFDPFQQATVLHVASCLHSMSVDPLACCLLVAFVFSSVQPPLTISIP